MDADNARIKNSLKFSFFDGIFASCTTGFTQDYFAPLLLVLGATVKHIGMLSALPNLFASLIQLKSADITEKMKSRRKTIVVFVLWQALMLLPMAAIAVAGRIKPIFFIFFVVLFTSFGALASPAWASLMSELIPKGERGAYLGWRNRILGFVVIGATFVAGLTLNIMKKYNVFYGFALIFSLAFIFRVISWYFLKKMHEPKLEYGKEHYFSFFNFLSRIRESNFAKFVLFVSLMNFSVNIASPFFVVLMLKDLHFSYLLYTLITITATIAIYATIGRWGRHADRIGNVKIIKFTAPLIGFIPFLWILNQNSIFLFLVQIFSGFLWAGFNLCTSNFIYDAVTPEKRTRCIAYFNTLSGVALCLGAIIGGFSLPFLPALFGHKILTLFAISSFLRIAVGIFLPRQLKEVRPVYGIKSDQLFFSMIGIRPLLGVERKPIRY